uniref:TIL domain-containing protein n=1 Tax=Plectus sambesii TaxID=2011161 RepID=A0A914V3F1_9BILA
MNSACCVATILLLAASCSSTPANPCMWMKCANGPCVDGKCTGSTNKCGPNMHMKECGSACPARCDLDPAASSCIALCKTGCFCDDGFVLEKAGGVCIRQENCPKQMQKREDAGCAAVKCAAGSICENGKCVRNPKCPLFMLQEPKEGCHYVFETNGNGCPVPKQVCPAV